MLRLQHHPARLTAPFLLLLIQLTSTPGSAQNRIATEPPQGIQHHPPAVHALVNARIETAPGQVIEQGVLIIRNGQIDTIGPSASPVPADARIWDCQGLTVFAGFIDAHTSAVRASATTKPSGAKHWNERVRPESSLARSGEVDAETIARLRKLGFTAALSVPSNGIFRGRSAGVALDDASLPDIILKEEVFQHIDFDLSAADGRTYPLSLMGCIALIRQTLLDARWKLAFRHAGAADPALAPSPQEDLALDALAHLVDGSDSACFHPQDELDFDRFLDLASEFSLRSVFAGNGYEYRRASTLAQRGARLIVPLNFPDPPEVADPEAALEVSLERLQHWELAPSNAAILHRHGIPFALTTHGLENAEKTFWNNLRTAVRERGLPRDTALAALTSIPAAYLGLNAQLGLVEKGRPAFLTVCRGDPFTDPGAKIDSVWIGGKRHGIADPPEIELPGVWELTWHAIQGPSHISVQRKGKSFALVPGTATESSESATSVEIEVQDQSFIVRPNETFPGAPNPFARLSARVQKDTLTGTGVTREGTPFVWSGRRQAGSPPSPEAAEEVSNSPPEVRNLTFTQYPAGAFPGLQSSKDAAETILIRNATVWTCGPSGVVESCDLLVRNGKLEAVGPGLSVSGAVKVVDASGKHVTPGLIDCHSHIAINRGVNEQSHAVTLEVRIGDVLDPTDIAIYRQLAGGLTTANLLHGSANPMGGQSQVIKLRWGSGADGLAFQGAPPSVKFALGENVKQSNWGEEFSTRYPQSRLGVEQVFRDTFLAAADYRTRRDLHAANPALGPFRRDLRMEAALEILEGNRLIHIHSYRQDEILMFARLAKEQHLRVAAFQHVLEGYKVADAIAEIGAGGSSFSDWWAYKFEVYDAIPYNGAILHRAGVLTSFNSDDAELGRRMNLEAAKAVKYGGLSEQDALNFVTLNPARQLGIDHRVGSLEPGKDADFVVWSGHPLSNYTRCEQTWIDGRLYFSIERDQTLRQEAVRERERLVALILSAAEKTKDEGFREGAKRNDENPEADAPPAYEHAHHPFLTLEFRDIYHDGACIHCCSTHHADHRDHE